MTQLLPGQKIGIIGDTALITPMIHASQLYGYEVYCYHSKTDTLFPTANKEIHASYTDKKALVDFANEVDALLICTNQIELEHIYLMSSKTEYFHSFELAEISQNKFVEKLFLEELRINVAPYSLVTSVGELPMILSSIGFPAVLEVNKQTHTYRKQIAIYDHDMDNDVLELLEEAPGMISAFVPAQRHFTVSVLRDYDGQIEILPISEDVYVNGRLKFSIISRRMNPEWKDELNRLAYQIIDPLAGSGLVTIKVVLAKNNVFYVTDILRTPTLQHHFNSYQLGISSSQLFIRLAVGLPVNLHMTEKESIMIPIYPYMMGKVNVLMLMKPDWEFEFFSTVQEVHEPLGIIRLTGPSSVDLLNDIENCDLFFRE